MCSIQAREPSILEIADPRATTLEVYDSDTDSSVTLDDGSARLHHANDVVIISDNCPQDPTPFLLNSNAAANLRELVDLTNPTCQAFDTDDYRTDEEFELLLETWQLNPPSPRVTIPVEENHENTRVPVHEVCVNGILYKAGQSLELYDGSYLRICTILKDGAGAIYFNGRRLIKTRNHAGTYVPKEQNELVWIVNAKESISFHMVKKFANVIFTNRCQIRGGQQELARPGGLCCRLKEKIEGGEVSIEFISSVEADEGYKIEPAILRHLWRGKTRAFGDEDRSRGRPPVIVLDDSDPVIDLTCSESVEEQKTRRQYTFGDGFCGAGGVSCGARRAGLYNKWAFDKSKHAISTYRLNFEHAYCELSDIFSFLTSDDEFLRVDVSHSSPPCQTFSPIHTIEGIHDDANSACIFSSLNLIKRVKPRVHTLEETNGLLSLGRHRDTFYRVINDFIETGYSVRWCILRLIEYGVPQIRKRLIVIASGPGETLPPFPRPSHGPGLREDPHIHEAISNIPLETANHDVQAALSRGFNKPPYDPYQPARTITCGGGDNYHPSGRRKFTHREYACLQTFPLNFRFGPHEVLKQIGNAVPPSLAEAMYKEIVRTLQETDEEDARRNMRE
ncbi:C-5 cytosine methyltransferase DmtA [Aspergillus bombycis]|uniref:DNA (cytosine-5-)-methyltransferase n=1 Tax=Aspergillus bombycis TaxID=109264 RepID=A0A1F8AEN2_9EURO|nr:C-5 cytosine methyltransferase DmtA [Aspergillus bombycis]OGM50213.1 C-5 cytosine methyltransferase DmtA [Aspergillus bombycis]